MALIGDSYSQDFMNMVIEGKYLRNYEIRPYYVHLGCQIYMGPEDRQQYVLPIDKQKCTNANDIKYALPIIRQADVIVLAALWRKWSAERLPRTIKFLKSDKGTTINYHRWQNTSEIVQPMLYVNKSKEYRLAQYRYPPLFVLEANIVLERTIDPSIFVNVMKMLCTGYNNTCPLFTREGKLISYDAAHLNKVRCSLRGENYLQCETVESIIS